MKSFYIIIVATFLCLSITACSKDSSEQNGTVEFAATTPDVSMPSNQNADPDADKNSGNNENIPSFDDIDSPQNPIETNVDLSAFFDGMSGTAVFLDKSGNYTVYNSPASEMQFSPCSTFKIISTLAAFEFDVITPSQSNIAWDGTKWKIESWNKDLTVAEAFQSSCVWYYRKLIDKIGKENMTHFLEILDYGNSDASQWEGSGFNGNPLIDGFWLESSLLISPQEQVDVICRIFEGKTDIEKNNIVELEKMMHKKDKIGNYNIYAKTGSGIGGWFVGFFESGGDNTYFAVYLNEQEGANGLKAQEITNSIIKGYFSETVG